MKKYQVIVKVDDKKFCKWRCDDLLSLVKFLDAKWTGWRWFNVYDNNKFSPTYKRQLGNFTQSMRPTSKTISLSITTLYLSSKKSESMIYNS